MIQNAFTSPLLSEATGSASTLQLLVAGAIGAIVALLSGFLLTKWIARKRLDAAQTEAERVVVDARAEADVIRKAGEVDAKAEFIKGQEALREEGNQMRGELKQIEKRLAKREDNLEGKLDTLATKERNLEQAQAELTTNKEAVAKREAEADTLLARRREELLKISGMSADNARKTVLEELQGELDHECAELVDKALSTAKDDAAIRAREITLTAI